MDCCICLCEIENDQMVEYKLEETDNWKNLDACSMCLQTLLDGQWAIYTSLVKKENCAASLKRMILSGPPVNLRYSVIYKDLNNKDDQREFYMFKLKNGDEFSAKLKDSFVDEERFNYINELNGILEFLIKEKLEKSEKSEISEISETSKISKISNNIQS